MPGRGMVSCCRHIPLWRAARQPTFVLTTPSSQFYEGCEQQLAGWFRDAVEYWTWLWFVNAKHSIAVHYVASVETNCAPNRVSLSAPAALKFHPVKSGLLSLWLASVGRWGKGKGLGAKWKRVLFYWEYFFNWSSSFVRKIWLIYAYSYSSPNIFLSTHIL